jgi:hypothetical protein
VILHSAHETLIVEGIARAWLRSATVATDAIREHAVDGIAKGSHGSMKPPMPTRMELPNIHVTPVRTRHSEAEESRSGVRLGAAGIRFIVHMARGVGRPGREPVLREPAAAIGEFACV